MTNEEIIKDKIIELYHNKNKSNPKSVVSRRLSAQIEILEEVLQQIKGPNND